MELSERITTLRKDILGLSQTDFAKPLGLTQSAIVGYEKGRRSLSPATIMAICREYNVSEAWLRNGEGEPLLKENISLMEGPVSECMDTLSSVYGLDIADIALIVEYMKLDKSKRIVIREFLAGCKGSINNA